MYLGSQVGKQPRSPWLVCRVITQLSQRFAKASSKAWSLNPEGAVPTAQGREHPGGLIYCTKVQLADAVPNADKSTRVAEGQKGAWSSQMWCHHLLVPMLKPCQRLCHCLRYPPVARSDIATSVSPARASSQPSLCTSPSILIATPNVHPQQSLCHLQHFFISHHLHATRSSTATTMPSTALLHPQQPLFHPWCLPLGSTELPWASPALGQGAAATGNAAHQRLPGGTELPFLQLSRDVSCLFPQFIIQLLPPAVCSTDESPHSHPALLDTSSSNRTLSRLCQLWTGKQNEMVWGHKVLRVSLHISAQICSVFNRHEHSRFQRMLKMQGSPEMQEF